MIVTNTVRSLLKNCNSKGSPNVFRDRASNTRTADKLCTPATIRSLNTTHIDNPPSHTAMEGKLHKYHPTRDLTLLEFTTPPLSLQDGITRSTSPNVLLFIGGMYDNYGTPGYVSTLGELFPRHAKQQWSVMHIQLSSAGRTFGLFDINRDIDEMASGINFIRETLRNKQPTNIVLMGHSTGCQDTLHYLHSANPTRGGHQIRPPVQGAILQAPVSDRHAMMQAAYKNEDTKAKYQQCLDLAAQTPDHERHTMLVPTPLSRIFGPMPLTITRFLDLASPGSPDNPSIEDLLSFDLPASVLNRTFGNVGANGILSSATNPNSTTRKSMLVLISGSDECYTPDIAPHKAEYLPKWRDALRSNKSSADTQVELHPESKCIPHAKHDVSGDDVASKKARLVDLRGSVLRYIDDVVGHVEEATWDLFRRDEKNIGTHAGEGEQTSGSGDIKL